LYLRSKIFTIPEFFERRAGFEMKPHVAAQVKGSRGVLTRRQLNDSPSRRRAAIDGLLNRHARLIGLLSCGPIVFHVKHRWARPGHERAGKNSISSTGAERNPFAMRSRI
jgi:hypothetical protein